jgi:aldehyde oxidoreductase
MTEQITVQFALNREKIVVNALPETSLLELLSGEQKLHGIKNGCAAGHCGVCTVILNGKVMRACLVKMKSNSMSGAVIETVEGLSSNGKLHPLQPAFIQQGAVQ